MGQSSGPRHIQYGALPWRREKGALEILLITSLTTRRWIVPKGWPVDKLSPGECAAHEALEEAGVAGEVADKALGVYRYKKLRKSGAILPCEVHVYAMKVQSRNRTWVEKKARESRWCSVPEALARVTDAGLRRLIVKFAKKKTARRQGRGRQGREIVMNRYVQSAAILALVFGPISAQAQSDANLAAFRGLAPVTALENTPAGKAALDANLKVTGAIQDGSSQQPALQPFAQQQAQALYDAISTISNGAGLADALGTKLGAAYQALATHTSTDDGATTSHTDVSPAMLRVVDYAYRTSNSDSATTKSFFGDGKQPDGSAVSAAAAMIMPEMGGKPDMFGRAYGLAAGAPLSDPRGNSRPFQTEPHLFGFRGTSRFGVATNSVAYLYGPTQDLRNNPSFPSGHTTYGYTESVLLGILVPERYPEMVARGAEYGNSRIVLGAHYAMDVLGGRTVALYDLAQLLANKPGYVGVERNKATITDFPKAVAEARADLVKALEAGCGDKIAVCARQDQSRYADAAKVEAFYESTQTYGLPVVFNAAKVDVAKVAPEAGLLLTAAFPKLSLKEANAILTETQGPGGGFIDNGSAFGVYSRLDLYRAAKQALAHH